MVKSSFQFKTPQLTDMQFVANEGFEEEHKNLEDLDLVIQIQTDHSPIKNNSSSVSTTISIGENNTAYPFYLLMTMTADFKWLEGSFDDKTREALLTKNAPSLLVGYMRPLIATVTSASRFPAYDLPFIDFAHMKAEENK